MSHILTALLPSMEKPGRVSIKAVNSTTVPDFTSVALQQRHNDRRFFFQLRN